MTVEQWIGLGLTAVGLAGIPIGVALVRMWSDIRTVKVDVQSIKLDHDKTVERVDHLTEGFVDVKTMIAAGFARIEEQIKNLQNGGR